MLPVRLWMPETLLVWRQAGRVKVVEEGRCRLCERDACVRPLTRHHIVPCCWFKRRTFHHGARLVPRHLVRDVDANVVPLCAPCHASVEADEQTRKMLRKRMAAQEAAFAAALRGVAWFDGVYPRSVTPALAGRPQAAAVG